MCERTLSRVFLCFLVSGVTGMPTNAPCPVVLHPTRMVLRYGESISVNCSTTTTGLESMGWEVTVGDTGAVENVTSVTWTVENLTDWKIEPTCYINKNDLQCFKTLPIVLYKTPDSVSIGRGSDTGPMTEGKEYPLICDIKDIAPVEYLTVRWYKGNENVKNETFNDPKKTPVNLSPSLNITPSRDDNGAQYRCVAELDLGPEGPQPSAMSSQLIDITVHFGPEMNFSPFLEILEGKSLESCCMMQGNPSPRISWMKDGHPIVPSEPLSRTDTGQYFITAEGHRNVTISVQVSVVYGPEFNCPNTYSAVEYAPHNLSCTVEGYPTPEIVWFRDGDMVHLPENLTRSDAGHYSLSANSSHSVVIHSLDIDILYPPSKIRELVDSEEVDIGSTFGLKCSSTGNPRPEYSWIYYPAPNVMVQNDDGVSLLHVNHATGANRGSYTCYARNKQGQVSKTARVTVRETAYSVSISPLNHTGPMVEGTDYQLLCDIQNVAPVKYLTVRWYKGNKNVKNETFDDIKTPVNLSHLRNITPSRDDNGAQYTCVAELDLGPEGPQPPPVTSAPFNIIVYYKPCINATKLPARIPVFRGYPEELVCEAEGYPQPRIQWLYDPEKLVRVAGGNLTVSEAGLYNCTATNDVETIFVVVEVVLKEDYLPLIAGFVAATVVVISVIFVFIYCIYYKNTKMGRYSLKNAKPNTQNGDVAQNGRDTPLPMTKLSQPNIYF